MLEPSGKATNLLRLDNTFDFELFLDTSAFNKTPNSIQLKSTITKRLKFLDMIKILENKSTTLFRDQTEKNGIFYVKWLNNLTTFHVTGQQLINGNHLATISLKQSSHVRYRSILEKVNYIY